MNAEPLYIQAIGMASPLGLTAASGSAAMVAGISRVKELPYRDNRHAPLRGSFLARLGQRLTSRQRWLALLSFAVRDMLEGIPSQARFTNAPMLLALPPDSGGTAAVPDLTAILGGSAFTTANQPKPHSLHVLIEGALGGYRAIAQARTMLQRHEAVIVAGADSLVTAPELQRLEEQGRLLTDSNTDGVIPGEAAACMLLSFHPGPALGTIRGVGFGTEPGLLINDVPLRGHGVVEAARAALVEAGLAMHHIDFRLSDAAGEGYSFKEQALAVSRLLRQRKEEFPLWLCASTLGDVGAAAGLCNMVWAIRAFGRGFAPGPLALAWASDGARGRGALVLDCRSL